MRELINIMLASGRTGVELSLYTILHLVIFQVYNLRCMESFPHF
jgi:hypothetical protein